MKQGIVEYIKLIATGRIVLIAILPATTVYFIMIFYTIPGVKAYAQNLEIFDLLPQGYSYGYATKLLEALGPEGRHAYLYYQLSLDFIFPALFGASFCLLLVWMVKKLKVQNTALYYTGLVPVIAAFLDYMENIQVGIMLRVYPDISEFQVAMASATTIGKSVLTTLCFIFLLVGMSRILWNLRTVLFNRVKE